MEKSELKSIVEALIFASDRPLNVAEIKEVLTESDEESIRQFIKELNQEYNDTKRSFSIQEVASSFRMVTKPEYSRWLKEFYKSRMKERLSRPSLETLAIIAYKQPVIKPEIEALRGVNVDGVIVTLLEKNLIKIAGRKDTIGRPLLYATTDEFLHHFGLSSLSEMPGLPEVKQLTDVATEVDAMEKIEAVREEERVKSDSADDSKNNALPEAAKEQKNDFQNA